MQPAECFDEAMKNLGQGFALMKQMGCTVDEYRRIVSNIHAAMTQFVTDVVIPELESTTVETKDEMGGSD